MFVVISFGILAFALAGAFVIWFYELFSNTNVRKERSKSSEGIRGSSSNDKLLYQDILLLNLSEYEELPMNEESNDCKKNFLIRKEDGNDIKN